MESNERVVVLPNGQRITVVATAAQQQQRLQASKADPADAEEELLAGGMGAAAAATAAGAAPLPGGKKLGAKSQGALYYCSVCKIGFNDANSAAAHKLSRRHKLNAGEPLDSGDSEFADAGAALEALRGLIGRKQAEKGVTALSQLMRKRGRSPGGEDTSRSV